jgi:hypothetical protein
MTAESEYIENMAGLVKNVTLPNALPSDQTWYPESDISKK